MKGKIFNKKLLMIGTVFLIIVCSFSLIFAFPVSAATTFQSIHEKPLANEYSGYIEAFCVDDQGGSKVYIYFWRFIGDYTDALQGDKVFGQINVTSHSLSINFSNSAGLYFVYGWMRTTDQYCETGCENITGANYSPGFWVPAWETIYNIKFYGNVECVSNSLTSAAYSWNVTYGSDTVISRQIDTLTSVIQSQNNNDIIANADKNSAEIQANANANADKVTSGIQQSTEEITQGGKEYDKLDDSTANDFSNAEQEALGGKTDAQIQAEVNDALNGGTSGLDFTKANRISNFFNNCMSSFGIETLVVFSLCMGLGAFIIGRRYG